MSYDEKSFTKDCKGKWNSEVHYWWNLEEVHREVKAEGTAGFGAPAFIRVCNFSALGPQTKTGMVNLNQNSRVLVSFVGVLPKGYVKGKSWKAGDIVKNLHLPVTESY